MKWQLHHRRKEWPYAGSQLRNPLRILSPLFVVSHSVAYSGSYSYNAFAMNRCALVLVASRCTKMHRNQQRTATKTAIKNGQTVADLASCGSIKLRASGSPRRLRDQKRR